MVDACAPQFWTSWGEAGGKQQGSAGDKLVTSAEHTGGPLVDNRLRPPPKTTSPARGQFPVRAIVRKQPLKKKQPPLGNGRRKLLQGAANRTELLVQAGAQAVHDGDDRQRDTGCNQAVFDRGRTGLIGPKLQNHALHVSPPLLFQAVLA